MTVELLRFVESILRDQRTVLPVSSLVPGEGKKTTVELKTREWDYYQAVYAGDRLIKQSPLVPGGVKWKS